MGGWAGLRLGGRRRAAHLQRHDGCRDRSGPPRGRPPPSLGSNLRCWVTNSTWPRAQRKLLQRVLDFAGLPAGCAWRHRGRNGMGVGVWFLMRTPVQRDG